MALRDLLAKISIQSNPEAVEKVNQALDKTKKNLEEVGDKADKLEKLEKGLDGIRERLDFIIGYEMLKGLYELTEKFAKLGEEIAIAAKVSGMGVEQFQALAFAAKNSGVSQEQMMHSVQRLSRSLYEARIGNTEAQQTLANIGIQPHQIASMKNGESALLALSGRLSQMNDPMAKLALTTKVLGRGSMEMVAFLSQGPAAIRSQMGAARSEGLVLTEHQVESLEKLEHSFNKLHQMVMVVAGTIAEMFAPVVEKMVDAFVKFYKANKDWIDLNVKEFLKDVAFAMGFLTQLVIDFGGFVKKHFGKDQGWTHHILEIIAAVGVLATALVGLGTLWAGMKIFGSITGMGKLLGGIGGGAAGTAGGAATTMAEGYIGNAAGATAVGAGGAAEGGLMSAIGPFILPVIAVVVTALAAIGIGMLINKFFGDKISGGIWNAFGQKGEDKAMADAEEKAKANYLKSPAHLAHMAQQNASAGGGAPHVTVQQQIHAAPGMSAADLAKHAHEKAHQVWNEKMRETHRGVQGAKVGATP